MMMMVMMMMINGADYCRWYG